MATAASASAAARLLRSGCVLSSVCALVRMACLHVVCTQGQAGAAVDHTIALSIKHTASMLCAKALCHANSALQHNPT
jgi:hypothetical protein